MVCFPLRTAYITAKKKKKKQRGRHCYIGSLQAAGQIILHLHTLGFDKNLQDRKLSLHFILSHLLSNIPILSYCFRCIGLTALCWNAA